MNSLVTTEIISVLNEYKRKPYLPIWGEIFLLLYKVKRKAENENIAVEAYTIGKDVIVYDPTIKKFSCQIGEITFRLTIEELTDSIVDGAFMPIQEDGA